MNKLIWLVKVIDMWSVKVAGLWSIRKVIWPVKWSVSKVRFGQGSGLDKNQNLSSVFEQLALQFSLPEATLNSPKVWSAVEHAMKRFSHACLSGT